MSEVNNLVLSMDKIDKRFPGVHALKGFSLELRSGEIYALVGENGAGKSTLMKALTGIYPKDSGKIKYWGKEINPQSPKEVLKIGIGIGIIQQELNMMDHLTVAQNVFIGRESTKIVGRVIYEEPKSKSNVPEDAEIVLKVEGLMQEKW